MMRLGDMLLLMMASIVFDINVYFNLAMNTNKSNCHTPGLGGVFIVKCDKCLGHIRITSAMSSHHGQ